MIEYTTKVEEKDKTTFILSANGKSISVDYRPERPCSYSRDRIEPADYKYEGVSVYDNLTIDVSKSHLATVVLAIELVKVIKENQ